MKKAGYIILLIVLGVGLAGCGGEKKEVKKEKERVVDLKEAKGEVSLIIDFGDNEVATYSGVKVEKGETVFDILTNVSVEEGFEVELKKYDFGYMITKIGDKEASDNYFWGYKVNGKQGEVGADKKEVLDGDIIEWKYQVVE